MVGVFQANGSLNQTASNHQNISQYPIGTKLILSEGINPNVTNSSDWYFLEWYCTGDGCYAGTSLFTNITMNSNITETAIYAPYSPKPSGVIKASTTTIVACSNSFSVPCSINGSIIVRTAVNTTVPVIVGGDYLSALTHT